MKKTEIENFDDKRKVFSNTDDDVVKKTRSNHNFGLEQQQQEEDAGTKVNLKIKRLSSKNVVSEEVFELAQKVKQSLDAAETKRQVEIERIGKVCEKEEERDRKYIEALKTELLEKYKLEQNRLQKKLENLKKKALLKIEQKTAKEKEKIDKMCEKEVLDAIVKFANKNSWFQVAIEIYRANPDFFKKEEK